MSEQTFAHGDGVCGCNCTDGDIGCGGCLCVTWVLLRNTTPAVLAEHVSVNAKPTHHSIPFLSHTVVAPALPSAMQPMKPSSIMELSTASWLLVDLAAVPWWFSDRTLRRSVVSRSTVGAGIACILVLMVAPVMLAVLSMSARFTLRMGLSTLPLLEPRWLVRVEWGGFCCERKSCVWLVGGRGCIAGSLVSRRNSYWLIFQATFPITIMYYIFCNSLSQHAKFGYTKQNHIEYPTSSSTSQSILSSIHWTK